MGNLCLYVIGFFAKTERGQKPRVSLREQLRCSPLIVFGLSNFLVKERTVEEKGAGQKVTSLQTQV